MSVLTDLASLVRVFRPYCFIEASSQDESLLDSISSVPEFARLVTRRLKCLVVVNGSSVSLSLSGLEGLPKNGKNKVDHEVLTSDLRSLHAVLHVNTVLCGSSVWR